MRRSRSHIAIDFGEHRVRALQLTRTGDDLAVTAAAAATVPAASDAAGRRNGWLAAGRAALRAAAFRGRSVSVALRLDDIETRHVRIPFEQLDHAAERIAAKVEEPPGPATAVSICPLAVSDLFEHGERKREFLCCIAPQPAIDAVVGLCEGLGKVPDRIDLGPLAMVRALLHDRPDASFVHLDIGATASRVTIVRAGEPVLMRSVAVGGVQLHRALQSRLQLELATLVDLDQDPTTASSPVHEAVVDALAESLELLVQRIADGIRYCGSLFHGRAVTSLLATGAITTLPGIVQYLGRRVGIPAEIARPFAAITAGAIPAHQRGEFTTALGLALGGLPR